MEKKNKGKINKLTLATIIFGYISVIAMIVGISAAYSILAIVDPVTPENVETGVLIVGYIIMAFSQIILLVEGALLIAKAKKVDTALPPYTKKFDLAMGIIAIVIMVLLVGGAIIIIVNDGSGATASFGGMLSFAWADLGEGVALASAIVNTVWLAKDQKKAKKATK